MVIRLDTPGGLDSAMRDIIQRIEAAKVPVIVYVSPSGARAASAGTFITMAANIAAMAPNTAIGAAHPVGAGGEEIKGPLGDKVTNDAVAYIRGIAKLRGRNEDWAEKAVRQSVSVDQDEAVDLHVVDLVAPDLASLLAAIDGRQVDLASGPVVLKTKDVPITENDMTVVERFLNVISDPNIAFILLSLGSLALLIEFTHPTIFTGVAGVLLLITAFFALGTLPVNWAGVFLIIIAFALFIAEVYVSGFGVLGIGGIIALIFGGLLLTSSSNPSFQVSRWLIFGVAAMLGLFVFMALSTLVRLRRQPSTLGVQSLVGKQGVARTALGPSGTVFINGERWNATVDEGRVEEGDIVTVIKVEGLHLKVKRAERSATDDERLSVHS